MTKKQGTTPKRFITDKLRSYGAAIHDHGSLDPNIAEEMLTSFRAGCSDESIPENYPQTALADGVAGSFACKTVQVVAFPADE